MSLNTLIALAMDLGRYDVFFDGDLDYKAAMDYNAIIQIAKLKLL